MRKPWSLPVAALTLILLNACQSHDVAFQNQVSASSRPMTPTLITASPGASANVRMGWARIEARTVCSGICAGKDGFAILSDGHFIAGPDAGGRTFEGQISNDELAALEHSSEQISRLGGAVEYCTSTGNYVGISHSIRITLNNDSSFIAYDQKPEGTLCMRGERAVADEFESVFTHLMYKYYPETFY